MKYILSIAAILIAAVTASSYAASKTPTTFHLIFGTQDVGIWSRVKIGRTHKGTYDGTNFDSSKGSGYATITLMRPANQADIANLYTSLGKEKGGITITALRGATETQKITCPRAMIDGFGIDGDPHTSPEKLVIACTKIDHVRIH